MSLKQIDSSNNTSYSKNEVDNKFNHITIIITSVIVVLLIMVAQLVIDSFRFSSVSYKEYSQKTESLETLQKANEELLIQIKEISEQSKEDRETIKKLLGEK